MQPDAGPSLIFQTLPSVFVNMAGGRLWGTLFFLFMTFASFSTVLAVFENHPGHLQWTPSAWSRKKASVIGCICHAGAQHALRASASTSGVICISSAPAACWIREDFLVSNLLLPIGSVWSICCSASASWGWGFENYLAEANTGKGPKLPRWLRPYFRYVLPLLIIVILVQGLLDPPKIKSRPHGAALFVSGIPLS